MKTVRSLSNDSFKSDSFLFYLVIICVFSQLSAFGQNSFHVTGRADPPAQGCCLILPGSSLWLITKGQSFVSLSLHKRDLTADSRTCVNSWQPADKIVSKGDWLNERSCCMPILNHQSYIMRLYCIDVFLSLPRQHFVWFWHCQTAWDWTGAQLLQGSPLVYSTYVYIYFV